ncbi:unnamed protein product [Boreogadus saida]
MHCDMIVHFALIAFLQDCKNDTVDLIYDILSSSALGPWRRRTPRMRTHSAAQLRPPNEEHTGLDLVHKHSSTPQVTRTGHFFTGRGDAANLSKSHNLGHPAVHHTEKLELTSPSHTTPTAINGSLCLPSAEAIALATAPESSA